jgi:hypothetical protein
MFFHVVSPEITYLGRVSAALVIVIGRELSVSPASGVRVFSFVPEISFCHKITLPRITPVLTVAKSGFVRAFFCKLFLLLRMMLRDAFLFERFENALFCVGSIRMAFQLTS